MSRYWSALLVGFVLTVPVGVVAADDHRENHSQRYYDRDAKDYHEWNDQEDRAYRRYMEEHHRDYRDFAKAKRDQQREYWRWRHQHPESSERR